MPDEVIGQDHDPDFSHAQLPAVLVTLGPVRPLCP